MLSVVRRSGRRGSGEARLGNGCSLLSMIFPSYRTSAAWTLDRVATCCQLSQRHLVNHPHQSLISALQPNIHLRSSAWLLPCPFNAQRQVRYAPPFSSFPENFATQSTTICSRAIASRFLTRTLGPTSASRSTSSINSMALASIRTTYLIGCLHANRCSMKANSNGTEVRTVRHASVTAATGALLPAATQLHSASWTAYRASTDPF